MTKKHIVLCYPPYTHLAKRETLCAIQGRLHLDQVQNTWNPDQVQNTWTMITPALTTLQIAEQAHFDDKQFCNSCRHAWRKVTSA